MAAAAGNEHTPCACVEILRGQLAQIGERAARRGEAMPAADTLIDALAAPIVYRVLFDLPPSLEHVQARVRGLLQAETRSEEHTSELQSQSNLVCRLLL